MRTIVFGSLLLLAALASPVIGRAMPAAPATGLAVANPAVTLVANGCGPGFHRRHWRDPAGHWHWGRCVPNH
jgi:hypothetical protein